jgi:hypothetical protein
MLSGRGMLKVKYTGSISGGSVTCQYKGGYNGEIKVTGKVREEPSTGNLIADVGFAQPPRVKFIKVQCSVAGKPFESVVDEPALRVKHLIRNVTVSDTFLHPLEPVGLESKKIKREPRGVWESTLKTSHWY